MAADDAVAFQELIFHFNNICYRVAVDLLQDEHIAEDIIQDAFLKVWLRRKQMVEIDNFGGWLRTITVNLVYDHISKQKKEKIKTGRWLEQLSADNFIVQPATANDSEFESLVAEGVKLLSPRQYEVFNLIKRQGYTRQQAADQLKLGQETIKYHLDLAMKIIRAYCIKNIDPLSVSTFLTLVANRFF